MRKLLYSIITCALVASCALEIDDVFDKSANERLTEAMAAYKEILVTPQKGWLMEYFPSDKQAYGGYTVLMKFEKDGTVTVATSLAGPTPRATSEWIIDASEGPVLSLNTYNELMHYFGDPALSEAGGVSLGYEGDFEFVYKEGDSKGLVVKGKKTGNWLTMTPFPENKEWSDYLSEAAGIFNVNYQYIGLKMDVGDKSTVFYFDDVYDIFKYINPDNADAGEKSIAFRYTDDGMKFYKPLTIMGKTIQTFEFNEGTGIFTCLEDSSVKLQAFRAEGYMRYEEYLGFWDFYAATTATGNVTKMHDWELTQSVYEREYLVKGLTYSHSTYGDYDWENFKLVYRRDGSLEIKIQNKIGTYNRPDRGNPDVKITMNTITGSNSSGGYGMKTEITSENPLYLTWVTNGFSQSTVGFRTAYTYEGSDTYMTRYYYPYMIKK